MEKPKLRNKRQNRVEPSRFGPEPKDLSQNRIEIKGIFEQFIVNYGKFGGITGNKFFSIYIDILGNYGKPSEIMEN